MDNYLLDSEFLKALFSLRERETYARITSLDIDERPRESLEGRMTGGSVNFDGNSSMRRSCSLSLTTDFDSSITDYYWALTTKFKLEIGVKNDIDDRYPRICYFPKGIYVITNFSLSSSTIGYNISIQGKDKMCLINGQVSGAIYSRVDFGTIEEIDENGNKTLRDYEIEDIIRESVHEYAKEPFHNIIIRDVPKYGLFLMNYLGDKPMYILVDSDNKQVKQSYINGDTKVYIDGVQTAISDEEKIKYIYFNQLVSPDPDKFTKVSIEPSGNLYYVMRVMPGQAPGYKLTTLTYPRDIDNENSGLIANVGEPLTSILDKIISMLGDYEYFYNLDGQFVFQKKMQDIDTNWPTNEFDAAGLGNPYILTNSYPNNWIFNNGELITAYSNTPNIGNIKNDFSIWGTKVTSNGAEIPVHLRYAIDKKPKVYTRIKATKLEVDAYKKLYEYAKDMQPQDSITYATEEYINEQSAAGVDTSDWKKVDWREIIYRMAKDYRKFNHWDGFYLKIIDANGRIYPGGITGYEQYYVDLEGFWRELYDPRLGDEPPSKMDSGYIYEPIEIDELNKRLADKTLTKDEVFVNEKITLREDNLGYYLNSSNQLDEFLGTNGLRRDNFATAKENCFKDTNGIQVDKKLCYDKDTVISSEINESNGNDFYIENSEIEDNNFYYKDGSLLTNIGNPIDINKKYLINYKLFKLVKVEEISSELVLKAKQNALVLGQEGLYFNVIFKTQDTNEYFMFIGPRYKKVTLSSKGVLEPISNKYIYKGGKSYIKNGVYFDLFTRILPADETLEQLHDIKTVKFEETGGNVYLRIENRQYNAPAGQVPAAFEQLAAQEFINLSQLESIWNPVLKKWEPNSDMAKYAKVYFSTVGGNIVCKEYKEYITRDQYQDYYYESNDENAYGHFIDPYNKKSDKHLFLETKSNNFYIRQSKYNENDKRYDESTHWNKDVVESPESLIFWFDFLDSGKDSKLAKYGANIIQDRSKATSDPNTKAIYYRDALNVIYYGDSKDENRLMPYVVDDYVCFRIPESMEQYFAVSTAGKSCKDVLDEYLYNYTYANESVSISVLPIYSLEPGDRIIIQDENTIMNGQYKINTISFPLNGNGMMNINATKVIEKLY